MIYPLKGVYSNPSLVLGGAAKCIMDEGKSELRDWMQMLGPLMVNYAAVVSLEVTWLDDFGV